MDYEGFARRVHPYPQISYENEHMTKERRTAFTGLAPGSIR